MAHLPIKAVVGRKHPPGAALHQLGPFTSSFPSGHAAADLAFTFGAAQELPRLFFPLSLCTMAVHWSLVRKRAHYPSDVLVGGILGLAVAATAWTLWPPKSREDESPGPGSGSEVRREDNGTPRRSGGGADANPAARESSASSPR
jgi:membrane-associated phospholipid phosphatase